MNRAYYEPIPCGERLPLGNPHAFSVSMPTYQDVVDYEEETNDIFQKICSAYPRIVFHPYVVHVGEVIRARLTLDENSRLFVLPTEFAANHVAKLSGTEPAFYSYRGYSVAAFSNFDGESIASYYAFMKHCGYMIYSREAESFLRSEGVSLPEFTEDVYGKNSEENIRRVLIEGYGEQRHIELTSSGMNAIYAGYEVVKQYGEQRGRTTFIQFGWVYSDTIQILKKLSDTYVHIHEVNSLDELSELLEASGDTVAGLITETISNPLLETPHIPKLSQLAKQYGFMLCIDNTFATPWNCNVSVYADVIFESLTKFASGRGDAMSGAILIPETSSLPQECDSDFSTYTVSTYVGELNRLALTIDGYKERMERINQITAELVDYFTDHPQIERLHHVLLPKNLESYRSICDVENGYGGVISIVPKGNFQEIYDALALPKGPSLGCDFPLLMPYTLLAHYDMVTSDEGLRKLDEINLSPWLIRISVGEDGSEPIIRAFESVFQETA